MKTGAQAEKEMKNRKSMAQFRTKKTPEKAREDNTIDKEHKAVERAKRVPEQVIKKQMQFGRLHQELLYHSEPSY